MENATITPIFKGGNKNRSRAENYRLISLTSVICKLLEHRSFIAMSFPTPKDYCQSNNMGLEKTDLVTPN